MLKLREILSVLQVLFMGFMMMYIPLREGILNNVELGIVIAGLGFFLFGLYLIYKIISKGGI